MEAVLSSFEDAQNKTKKFYLFQTANLQCKYYIKINILYANLPSQKQAPAENLGEFIYRLRPWSQRPLTLMLVFLVLDR